MDGRIPGSAVERWRQPAASDPQRLTAELFALLLDENQLVITGQQQGVARIAMLDDDAPTAL